MTVVPETLEKVLPLAKGAQILALIKDNQLLSAAVLFILWQAGAISQGLGVIGGVC